MGLLHLITLLTFMDFYVYQGMIWRKRRQVSILNFLNCSLVMSSGRDPARSRLNPLHVPQVRLRILQALLSSRASTLQMLRTQAHQQLSA